MANDDLPTVAQRDGAMVARYTEAIEALSEPRATFTSVAKRLGITRRTLFNWRRDPLYRALEHEQQSALIGAACAELKAMVLDAVKVLRDSLTVEVADRDEAAQWVLRQQAAKAVLDRVGITPERIHEAAELSDEDLDRLIERLGLRAPPKPRVVEMPSDGEGGHA